MYLFQLPPTPTFIGAGLAFSAIGAVGLGVGVLFNGLLMSSALAPAKSKELLNLALLGFALVESCLLFAMLSGLILLFL